MLLSWIRHRRPHPLPSALISIRYTRDQLVPEFIKRNVAYFFSKTSRRDVHERFRFAPVPKVKLVKCGYYEDSIVRMEGYRSYNGVAFHSPYFTAALQKFKKYMNKQRNRREMLDYLRLNPRSSLAHLDNRKLRFDWT